VGTYLLAGGIGLPVFAGLRGGLAILVGPTGGYLFGFLLGAVAGAWVRARLLPRTSPMLADAAGAAVVIVCAYLAGWLQLILVAGMTPVAALVAGVLPFIAPDALKAVGAVAVAPMVRKASRL
jgi:biotin transport system substrate-specific component